MPRRAARYRNISACRSMVLLWGLQEDGPLANVAAALSRIGAEIVVIDQRRMLEYSFELEVNGKITGIITGPDVRLQTDDVTAIYLRQYNFEQLDVFQNVPRQSETWRQAVQFEESMLLWSDVAQGVVVNRPAQMAALNSKPAQLGTILQCGFLAPETVITSDPECVLAFRAKHKRVIYKSISSCRSIVAQLPEGEIEGLEDVGNCPTQFQQFIAGTDYRVHVVDHQIYATRIVSDADDYRYGRGTKIEPSELPPEVVEKCLKLHERMGLAFSGIDLRCSPEGEWYCFEVNPSPGFSYFDTESCEISMQLARLLSGK